MREREKDYGSERMIGSWGFREREILEVKVLERDITERYWGLKIDSGLG